MGSVILNGKQRTGYFITFYGSYRTIPRVLRISTPPLVSSSNAVVTSTTLQEETKVIAYTEAFLPLPDRNKHASSIFLIIFSRPLPDIEIKLFFLTFTLRNSVRATAVQSPFLQNSFTSRARSLIQRVITTFSNAIGGKRLVPRVFIRMWYA